jgi:hypothetical protein
MNLAFRFNSADVVITFNHCICWVNYYIGDILFYEVLEEERSPKISYLRLPIANRSFATRHPEFGEANHTLCVNRDGDVLKYITAICTDRELYDPIPPHVYFLVLTDTLCTTSTGEMGWVQGVAVTSHSLWARNTFSLPQLRNNTLMFPLVSMDDPNIVHFMLSEVLSKEGNQEIHKVSLVMINFLIRMVNSVVPYIEGDEELNGQDAYMVKEKSHLLKSFIPSKFPKFFNLTH